MDMIISRKSKVRFGGFRHRLYQNPLGKKGIQNLDILFYYQMTILLVQCMISKFLSHFQCSGCHKTKWCHKWLTSHCSLPHTWGTGGRAWPLPYVHKCCAMYKLVRTFPASFRLVFQMAKFNFKEV